MSAPLDRLQIRVQVSTLIAPEVHTCIETYVRQDQRPLVLNVNGNCLNLAYKKPWLCDFLNTADIVFCDGTGVMLGARILGYRISQRITYADWIWQRAEFAAPRGIRR